MDPLFMQGIAGFGKGLGEAIGGGGPFVGGSSSASTYGANLGNSGWVVNMGGTQVASASPTSSQTLPQPVGVAAAQAAGSSPALMLGIAALVAVLAIRAMRKRK